MNYGKNIQAELDIAKELVKITLNWMKWIKNDF